MSKLSGSRSICDAVMPWAASEVAIAGGVERAGEDLAKRRVVLDDEDVRRVLVGQQVPGPIGGGARDDRDVSLKVAGGLKAWWLGETSSTSTVCRPGARSTGTCQTSTVGAWTPSRMTAR